ncbi:MAG: hypothetical protein ABIP07_00540 [Sphingomicrobium sp.]
MSVPLLLAMVLITNAAPTEAQLSSRAGDEDIIPAYFQGTWGNSLAACADDEGTGTIIVSATRVQGYELDARLLKIGGIVSAKAPDGGDSHYAELLLAESGEGRVGLGTLVISRVKDKLYVNRKIGGKDLTEAQQYNDPSIPCPVRVK